MIEVWREGRREGGREAGRCKKTFKKKFIVRGQHTDKRTL